MNEQALTTELASLLAERHFYEPFPSSCVADLLEVLRHVRLAPGQVLMRQGDHGDDMYLVLAGRVAVEVEHGDGTRTVVDEVGTGNVVGEMALLTGLPRTATVSPSSPPSRVPVARGFRKAGVEASGRVERVPARSCRGCAARSSCGC